MSSTQKNTPSPMVARIDRLMSGDGPLKAYASVTIAGKFAVHDIRITESDNTLHIGMPFRSYSKNGETKYTDIFHAVTGEARKELVDAVTSAYDHALEQQMKRNDIEESEGMSQQM